jgi:energy-coupling factor transporter ATP-binding protein EcfA2
MAKPRSPFVYFSRLALTNVKSFAEGQVLDLRDASGRPAPWTLVLGDNGVGKTTLLQCLALMRPIVSTEKGSAADAFASDPDRVVPGITGRENADIVALARMGSARVAIKADLVAGRRLSGTGGRPTPLTVSVEIEMENRRRDLRNFEPSEEVLPGFTSPLVVGYSAARHMKYLRGDPSRAFEDPTESLFNASVELADAEDILQRLDYAGLRGQKAAGDLLVRVKNALAKLLPDVERGEDISLNGPATPGADTSRVGVQVKTPYGEVPITALSLGYQTVTALAVDLAWKLFERYPKSTDSLQEPAVVLIDEIDLHLHPVWQRTIKRTLSEFFPQVQFVATAHSPLIAQSFLEDNIVVLRRSGDHVEIESDPAVISKWRVDEIVTSDLFGLRSAYPPDIDAALEERAQLLMLAKRTPAQKARLASLQSLVASLPSENDPRDQAVLDKLRSAAEALPG